MDRKQQQRFHGLSDTVAELNRMREFWRAGIDPPQEGRTHSSAWIPRMDIFSQGDDLVMRCELAGVARDEVDISFQRDVLTIFGERTGAPAVEESAYYVRERQYGSFRRTINLPEGTDRSNVTALLEDGLLEITVVGGCAARREPEHIEIAIGGGERG
ncbi:MAG: Hsp20/alpha crystallin family protein [Thermoleophilaceae bacterium]